MSQTTYQRLRGSFAHNSQVVDAFLTRLNRTLSKTAGAEAVLYTLCFTLVFIHTRLRRILERRYERLALSLASKASATLLPGEAVLATIEPPKTRLSELDAGVQSAAELVEDFLFFSRLRGLVSMYSWAREHYFSPPGDAVLRLLVWAQIASSVTFQTLENGAYLASKGILRGETWKRQQPRWAIWSNRFWLIHVLLEGARLLRVRQLGFNEDFGAKILPPGSVDVSGESKQVSTNSEALKKKWKQDFYANAGWFPLTLHWSFYDASNSPLNDTWVGVCGLVPGWIALKEAWAEAEAEAE